MEATLTLLDGVTTVVLTDPVGYTLLALPNSQLPNGVTAGTLVYFSTTEKYYVIGSVRDVQNILYSPLNDADLDAFALWDCSSGIDAPTVGHWLDSKNGFDAVATGTGRPTYSATAITDMFGVSHPGIVFNGANIMACSSGLQTLMTAANKCTLLIGGQGGAAGVQIVAEWGPSFTAGDGRWIVAINDALVQSVECGVHNATNTLWRSLVGQFPWYDPGVLTLKDIFGSIDGTSERKIDGVEMLGSQPLGPMTVAGTFANEVFYIGSRVGLVSPFTGVISHIFVLGPDATDAAIRRAQQYIGNKIGAPQP